jgi:hypothetical protein
MDGKTRQLVLETLEQAHETAYGSVRAALDQLPPEGRQAVQESLEEFKSCLQRQFEGTVQPAAATERIAALIYGHLAPRSVEVMERYAQTLNDLLCASRNGLTATVRRRDH